MFNSKLVYTLLLFEGVFSVKFFLFFLNYFIKVPTFSLVTN